MANEYDHILIVGFGGPEKPEEVMPFLRKVTEGRNIPEPRLRAVAHHYELIGGASPYNKYTFQLVDALRNQLKQETVDLPVFLGMRNWGPLLKDTIAEIHDQNLKKGIAFILAPHQSESSCQRYKQNVIDALKANNIQDIHYDFIAPWYDHPSFITAIKEETDKVYNSISEEQKSNLSILFCCHSIPTEMNEGCPHCRYSDQFQKTNELVAEECGFKNWAIAYQSRSGNPRTPWLGPDIGDKIQQEAEQGKKAILIIPVGFLCDNAEVLYDLDIEAKEITESFHMDYYRVRTVTDHPCFVNMITSLIKAQLESQTTTADTTCQTV